MKHFLLLLLPVMLAGAAPAAPLRPAAPGASVPARKAETVLEPERTNQKVIGQSVIPVELTVKVKPETSAPSITDKHPNAVYFVIIAAGLAALASIITSIITAISSWRLKSKEYKNEYHKKIIDKRLKAIEQAEQLIAVFNHSKIRKDGSKYFAFFIKESFLEEYRALFTSITVHSLWYSRETAQSIRDFGAEINSVIKEMKFAVSLDVKKDILSNKHQGIIDAGKKIGRAITKDLMSMDDVDSFFKTRDIQNDLSSSKTTSE